MQANAADLRRVFANLFINAIDAMPQGGTLTVATFEEDDMVRVTVTDTGVGIPPEHQKKVFLPYFTTKSKGTGLGLSGAQRIVQSLGGSIEFASQPGRGTQFSIELPAVNQRQGGQPRQPRAA